MTGLWAELAAVDRSDLEALEALAVRMAAKWGEGGGLRPEDAQSLLLQCDPLVAEELRGRLQRLSAPE